VAELEVVFAGRLVALAAERANLLPR